MKRLLSTVVTLVVLCALSQQGRAQTDVAVSAAVPADAALDAAAAPAASGPATGAGVPAPAASAGGTISDVDLEVIRKDLQRLHRSCGEHLAKFTRERNAESKRVLYLSLAGLVAGAIIAPALTAANASANAGWIAGFAGFAGATNTATGYMRSFGFSGEDAAASFASATTEVDRRVTDALTGTRTLTERRLLILLAEEKCRFVKSEAPPADGT